MLLSPLPSWPVVAAAHSAAARGPKVTQSLHQAVGVVGAVGDRDGAGGVDHR